MEHANSILDHIWGKSPAADRVWAQVSGLSPSNAGKRLLMVWQAYVDDSLGTDGTFVLAGHVATAENWASFSAEWEALLPYMPKGAKGEHQFKMSHLAQRDGGIERSQAFYRIIERHVPLSLSCKINVGDIERAKNRVYVPNLDINWGIALNPFIACFRVLMDNFHSRRSDLNKVLPADEKVDFIFDNQAEKSAVLGMWDDYIERRPPEIRDLYGAAPRFEDDAEFLPIQAADFWAWWTREWHADGTPEKVGSRDFGVWFGKGDKPARIDIVAPEDALVNGFISGLHEQLEPGRPIYDIRFAG